MYIVLHDWVLSFTAIYLSLTVSSSQSQSQTYQSQLDRRKQMLDSTELSLKNQISQLEGQLERTNDTLTSQVYMYLLIYICVQWTNVNKSLHLSWRYSNSEWLILSKFGLFFFFFITGCRFVVKISIH